MKQLLLCLALLTAVGVMAAEERTVASPDGRLVVKVTCRDGLLQYGVEYDGIVVVKPSLLGLRTNVGDFTKGLSLRGAEVKHVEKSYEMSRTKRSHVDYVANQLLLRIGTEGSEGTKGSEMTLMFNVSDNDIAFRYGLGRGANDNPKCAVVYEEATSFLLPDGTTTFLTPQITPMTGWERTKPSYEEEYTADADMRTPSRFGVGYTFPCLFKAPLPSPQQWGSSKAKRSLPQLGENERGSLWVLVSETGVTSAYCGSRLSDYEEGRGYKVAYPQKGEQNGFGSEYAAIPLPGETPWRTITVGSSLKPIVETTVAYDVVDPLYEAKYEYKPGRYTWSWLIWQDQSINYDDQVKFIDLASAMGFEYTLVDNWWDTQIGREKIEQLSKYAQGKGVHLLLWYNSNGYENDAPQGPRNIMCNSIQRKKEMAWMQRIGVKGIKVDFFAGDKQETMRLYEDILSDANEYGLQVIFHGCTLPRGWERMYPNYVGSEAALASENVYFSDYHAKKEGYELSMYPFTRNAVAAFDWGGIMMNRWMSKDNKSRHRRFTGNIFEIATGITNQCSVNCVAMQPNNLNELSHFELDFLKQLPTAWDETRFIDGYPGKFVVIARRTGDKWYVGGINGGSEVLTLTLQLPMFAGETVSLMQDLGLDWFRDRAYMQNKGLNAKAEESSSSNLKLFKTTTLKVNKKGEAKVTIQPMGGIVIY